MTELGSWKQTKDSLNKIENIEQAKAKLRGENNAITRQKCLAVLRLNDEGTFKDSLEATLLLSAAQELLAELAEV
ncbi:MAG TPA: hypothetical protein DEP87_01485 [Candidatus Pacebacteria bacterium]|nr:hypothetical protein [Candidatus Paceibacterota bacterium]